MCTIAAESAFAALPALIANLALELAPVRVNLIAADFVDTPLSASLLGDELENRRNQLRATDQLGFDCKVAACEIGDVCGEEHTRRLFIG